MVLDVRWKVRMRLRAFIAFMSQSYTENQELRMVLRRAEREPAIAANLKLAWHRILANEFPGCEITCTPNRIYIRLPDRYPVPEVPISETYPGAFTPALFGEPTPPNI